MNLRLLCCKLNLGFHFVDARNQALLSFSACLGRFLLCGHRSRHSLIGHARCPNHGAFWHCFEYTKGRRATHLEMSIPAYVRTVHMYVYIYTYIHMHIYGTPPSMSVSYRFWRFDCTAKSVLSMTFSMTVASGTSASLAIAAFQIIRTASPYWTLSNPNVLQKFLGNTVPESLVVGVCWGFEVILSHIQQYLSKCQRCVAPEVTSHPSCKGQSANHQLSNPKPSPQPGGDAASKALDGTSHVSSNC